MYYDYHRRENPKKNHRQHEFATVEQDATAGRHIQVGSHHQTQHETGGNRAKYDA